MIKRSQQARRGDESGFTLVELLVVIVILGILAAVVVFAVGGINDKGQGSACEIDARTIRTAEEAYFAEPTAGNGRYGNEVQLVPKFLSKQSTLHNVTVSVDNATTPANEAGTSYTVTSENLAKCPNP